MFRQTITQTPFTTDAANSCFQNIAGGTFRGDISFLATLRALLAPRMGAEDHVTLTFGASNYPAGTFNGVSESRIVGAVCNRYDFCQEGRLIIHTLDSDEASNDTVFKAIENRFVSMYDGYHRQEKLKEFYRKSFKLDCYINPAIKSTIVFVEKLDNKKLHYLQVSILAMLPWYLDQETGVSEEEWELIHSLRETSPEKYNQCLEKMVERYDLRSERIRKMLNGFETVYEKIELDRVRSEISGFDRKILDLNDSIGEYLRRRTDSCIKLMGLETRLAEGCESEIMEYFLRNRHLVLENVDGTNLYFAVKDYLEYFDSDMAEHIIGNRYSFVYRYGLARDGESGAEKAKKLLTEIFVRDDPRLKIRFCAAYTVSVCGGVQAMSGHDFGPEFRGYMPNTHIDRYACLGNYQRVINDALRNNNYISAIEQCVASCKSLNWGDQTVMEVFMDRFFGGEKCIELPDGTVVGAEQAIQWLEEQDKPVEDTHEDQRTDEMEEQTDEQDD